MKSLGSSLRCALSAIIATSTAAFSETAVDTKPALSTKVKAAYILNFARFTTWPDDAFDDNESTKEPLVIVVLGEDDAKLATTIAALTKNEVVHDRSIVVRREMYPDESNSRRQEEAIDALKDQLNKAHVLYIDKTVKDDLASVLQLNENKSLLTVSECNDFAAAGGMIGFIEKNGKIVFEANLDAIEKSDVEVSSKILRLAETVKHGE